MADARAGKSDGRIRRARRRVDQTRQSVGDRATQLEADVPVARALFRAYEHDRAVGGEIMAGAIAFRAFVFLVPLVLVLVTALGVAADADSAGAQDVAKQAGITGLAAQSVSESARVSSGGRWIALFLGLIALYSTSKALARALRIAHALAWQKPVPPMKRKWRAALVVIGIVLAGSVIISKTSQATHSHPLGGLVIVIMSIVLYAAAWLFVSFLLPHGDADWTELLPGAVLVGAGVLIMHLITVYYVAGKIGSASKLYGPLGGAVAILGWTYLLGRLTVASAVLNASIHRNRVTGAPSPPASVLPD